MIERVLKSNLVLFKIWYYLYRKHRGSKINYVSASTELYFDGYPRSGNTFGVYLIKTLWPELQIVHHFHAIAPIKEAVKKHINIFLLIRDPKDAISSWYLKYHVLSKKRIEVDKINHRILKKLISDYYSYYTWVYMHIDEINLIDFEQLKKYPEEIMKSINKALPRKYYLNDLLLEKLVESHKDDQFGAKDIFGSSLPNREKEHAKLLLITSLKKNDSFKNCESLYEKLIK